MNIVDFSSLTFFLPDEFLYRLVRSTSCFHCVFADMFENKSRSVTVQLRWFFKIPPEPVGLIF